MGDLRVGVLHARFVAQRQSTPAVARGHVARGGSLLWAAWPRWSSLGEMRIGGR